VENRTEEMRDNNNVELEKKDIEKKDNAKFVKQAGILAIAGIFTRIIGMAYRGPLYRIIGDKGNGLYAIAYNFYVLVLMISAYSIPSALSKAMAKKLTFKEYKNADRIFKCAMIYVLIVGAVGSLAMYFFVPMFFANKNAIPVLRVFAPVIFFQGILGVLRGYFQARKDMVKTSISQIVEQLFNAAGSVGFAYLLTKYMLDDNASKTEHAIYGASGSALGTGLGVIVGMIFMIFVYLHYRKKERRLIEEDTSKLEPYSKVFFMIISTVTPIILSTFIYNISITINQKVFEKAMLVYHNYDSDYLTTLYGYFGNCITFATIPIAMATAMGASLIPNLAGALEKKDRVKATGFISTAFRTIMLIAMPMAMGLCVLAREIIRLFYGKVGCEITSKLLICMVFAIIFYCVSSLTNAMLQAMGKFYLPVINASIALVAQIAIMWYYVENTDQEYGVYGLVLAYTAYSFSMCILNAIALKRAFGYKQDVLNVYVRPLASAVLMGVLTYGVNIFLRNQGYGALIRLVVAMCFAVIVYAIAIVVFKAVDEETLRSMPMGTKLIRIYKKVGLLK